MLDIDVEVADEDQAASGPDAFTAAAELAGLHVTLHDVDAVLLVKGDTRDLIKAHDVILSHEAALAGGIVDEHAGDGGLAPRDEVRVGRDLLEEMGLPRATWSKLDDVAVAFHEWDHA